MDVYARLAREGEAYMEVYARLAREGRGVGRGVSGKTCDDADAPQVPPVG